jgi:flagellar M-ring protein FliF
MENQKFGISQFAEQVNYQRGLEGELSRTIQSVGAVQAARVHLAIPKPSVFMREEMKPSASVLLNLYPGARSTRRRSPASRISSPPACRSCRRERHPARPERRLLSQMKSKLMEAGLDPTQVKYIQEVEASIIKRIEDILAPIVGPGNSRVQIAADIDFSQSEQTAETHRPNTTPPEISIRSQQTSETASTNPAQGVPGRPDQPAAGAGDGAADPAAVPARSRRRGQPAATRPDQCRRRAGSDRQRRPADQHKQEFDDQLRESTRPSATSNQAVGTVKRLSAAVVVNQRKEVAKDGKSAASRCPMPNSSRSATSSRKPWASTRIAATPSRSPTRPFTVVEKDEGYSALA